MVKPTKNIIMKNFILSIILILSVISSMHLKADDEITFKASAPSTVVMGTRFNLVYEANVTNGVDFRLPAEILENFDILMGPSSFDRQGTQIINGKRTSYASTTITTVLSPKKEGSFKIGQATIKIGSATYRANALEIKVLPPDQAAQAQGGGAQQQQEGGNSNSSGVNTEDIFMRMTVSKKDVYEQEGFLVTFKIYTVHGIEHGGNIKIPEFDDFVALDIEPENSWKVENYNGRNFRVNEFKRAILYPIRSGQLRLNSGKIDVVVSVPRQSGGRRSLIDDFFGNSSYQNVKKELISSPVTINVKPLPSGKPASFSNAVGNYTISSEINKTELKANEAVTVKLTIKGNGNIRVAKVPNIVFPNDFEVYDPKPVDNIKVTTAGASGTKTIEYMAIPRYAGEFEIPAVEFSYFDLKSETYKTISTEPYKLNVEKGEGGSEAPIVSNFTNRENVKFVGKDIRYIKTNKVHFISNKEIFFGSFLYVMAYLMITILFIVFFIIYRKQVKENANIALVRTKKANKTAVKRLKQAEKLLKDNKEEAFYEEVLRALWGYLSDKLNMPQSELTKENVSIELAKYGVDEALSVEFLEIINTCEFARYAPNKTSGAMDKLFSETIDAIGNMENTIKK